MQRKFDSIYIGRLIIKLFIYYIYININFIILNKGKDSIVQKKKRKLQIFSKESEAKKTQVIEKYILYAN